MPKMKVIKIERSVLASCTTTSIPTFLLSSITFTIFLHTLTFRTFTSHFLLTLRMPFFIKLILIILTTCTSTFLTTSSPILKTITIFFKTIWFCTLTRKPSIFFLLIINLFNLHFYLSTLNSPIPPTTCQFHSFFMNLHKLLKLL